jgi:hypothetical protein
LPCLGAGIFDTRARLGWDREEVVRHDHALGNASAELLDLLADVTQESVTRPLADEHDGIHRDASEVHRHGGTRAKRMEADLFGIKTKEVLAYALDGSTKATQGSVACRY